MTRREYESVLRIRELICQLSSEDLRKEGHRHLALIAESLNKAHTPPATSPDRRNEKCPPQGEHSVGTTVHDAGQPPASHV